MKTTNKNYTKEQFDAMQAAYQYFNKKLFGGQLANCILNFSRKSKARGFFAPKRWGTPEEKMSIHEISINPETLNEREPKAVISTLVHEMVHLWQQDYGQPSAGYHNKEWAAKMKEIGLQPSHTGEEGGRETGKNMTHYIVAGGPYEVAFNAMPEDFLYPFVCVPELSADEKKRKASKNKTKYTCPSCNENLWGKDSLLVQCAECEELFVRAA